MIYAQRPDATACAEWDFWNQRMRRYIRRGSKGIALIDTSRGRPVLRYVFDVSDTGCMDDGLNPNLWQYREEHRAAVAAALERHFEVSGEHGLEEQLEQLKASDQMKWVGLMNVCKAQAEEIILSELVYS